MGSCLSSHDREKSLLEENTCLRHQIETVLLQSASKNDTDVRRMFECKICFDDLVSIVFLPCGHCMSCKKCSTTFTKCPMCAIPIDNITYVTFP
jgi:hypothetical protein